MQRRHLLLGILCATVSTPLFGQSNPVKSVPYRWKSVQMVGAGFVDGIVCHPTAKDVRYARTDMGGAYRWDARARRWAPMLDWVSYSDLNLMGVESIAVDPTNPKRVYLACGTYTNPSTPDGAILISTDGGRSFEISRVPIKFGGNENGRGNGERLSVDPNDPRVLFLGTRHDGVWRSANFGKTWTRCGMFNWKGSPRGAGVIATWIDPASGLPGKPSGRVVAAISDAEGPNLVQSRDGGLTWNPVPNAPTGLMPTHLVADRNGTLWITYGDSPGPSRMTRGSVWKWDTRTDRWQDVTPEATGPNAAFGYAAVSVQADRPETVIVSSFGRPGGEQIFRTINGGSSWTSVIGDRSTYRFDLAPYTERVGIHWLFDIEIDPANPDHAMFTTGYGGHETFNLSAADRGESVIWHSLAPGIEESVALALTSPPQGAHLISAIGDYGGFVHWDLDRPQPEGNFMNPHFGNTSDVAYAALAPETLVRVGIASGLSRGAGNIGYSRDGGRTWSPTKTQPEGSREGKIAVSADGQTWIWSFRRANYRTNDRGETWTPVEGLLRPGLRVIADAVNPNKFYALDLEAQVWYRSVDAGAHFAPLDLATPPSIPLSGKDRGDDRGGQDTLYATPGREGDLWLPSAFGLLHLNGPVWDAVSGIESIHGFGFGAPQPGRKYPAMYFVGTYRGVRGFFRSTDSAKSWVRINDDAHQWGLVFHITGDPKRFGRVYVGTHGRGTFYGDPR